MKSATAGTTMAGTTMAGTTMAGTTMASTMMVSTMMASTMMVSTTMASTIVGTRLATQCMLLAKIIKRENYCLDEPEEKRYEDLTLLRVYLQQLISA
jgi:hypothetical protein